MHTPNLSFTYTDVVEFENSMLLTYEKLTGKKLFEGDPVTIFLKALTQIIFQQSQIIDFTAKQNLLSYATGDYLDNLVALVGVSRLDSLQAMTTLRFTISSAQPATSIVIPKGTRVKGNELYFQTVETAHIAPGQLSIDIAAECTEKGAIGNNILPGQLSEIVDAFPFYQSVSNLTKSSGGTDIESDEALRARAFDAPSAFSTAGSDAAYAFFAKSVSPEIMDVKVISENPGEVSVIVIGPSGEPLSDELLEKILAKCSDKKVKPLTDKVSVQNATQIHYDIAIEYFIDEENKNNVAQIQNAVAQAITRYTTWQESKLGRDINPNKLMYELMAAGIKRATITSPVFTHVEPTHIAKNSSLVANYGGLENE